MNSRYILLLSAWMSMPPLLYSQGDSRVHRNAFSILSARNESFSDTTLPIKCGLPVISAALQDRDRLTAAERGALETVLLRDSLQKSIAVGNFRIHYDTTGPNAAAMIRRRPNGTYEAIPGTSDQFADSVGAIVNSVFALETSTLGYDPPPSDGLAGGDGKYDIYVIDFGSQYGETVPEQPLSGGRWTTYMRIDNDFIFVNPDSNKGLPALRVTVAHEFFHAIQLGSYGYWTSDIYYYEISSVWMEDKAYTDVNDYYQYLRSSQGHFRNPEVPFTSDDFIMYSRSIWAQYVERRYGTDAIKRSWEEIRSARPLLAIDNALSGSPYLSSFRTAFAEWSLWNYFTGPRSDTSHYYSEGNNFPLIKQNAVDFVAPSGVIDGTGTPLNALSAKYYQVLYRQDSLTLILSNINFDAGANDPTSQFPYRFLLNTSRVDESYKQTSVGIYYKLDVSDPSNWYTWDVVNGGIGESALAEGTVFPNPFRNDGSASLHILAHFPDPGFGTLNIFSSSMDLAYSATINSTLSTVPPGVLFSWNGRTSKNTLAATGVYYFVLDLPGRTFKGKFALIRK